MRIPVMPWWLFVLAALAYPRLVIAVEPGAFGDGLQAQHWLGGGLQANVSLEEAHASGAKAELALQGARKATDGEAVQAGSGSAKKGAGQAGRAPSLKVNEPPTPGKPGEQTPPPPKPKKDWMKVIMKWLPIAIGLYASVQMIMNPVGSATFWVRSFAVIAAMGTGKQLLKEIRGK